MLIFSFIVSQIMLYLFWYIRGKFILTSALHQTYMKTDTKVTDLIQRSDIINIIVYSLIKGETGGIRLNINVNDTKIGSLLDYSDLNLRTEKADEKIRSTFGKKEPAASLKLSKEGKAAAKAQSSQKVQTSTVQKAKKAPWVKRDLVRTGYASIDNTIIDSLNGVSDEIRQYAYDIVRNDFLLDNAEGISEDERQDLISLGLSEAQYVADNYLSGDNANAFMAAMKKVAGIAAGGVREEDGTMDYGGIYRRDITQDGYTVEITDELKIIKQYRPEAYKEIIALRKEYEKTNDKDRFEDYVKPFLKAINEIAREEPDAWVKSEGDGLKRLERVSDKNVKTTFRNVDTKGTQNFIQALMQMQKGNAFSPFSTLTNRINTILGHLGSQTWQSDK